MSKSPLLNADPFVGPRQAFEIVGKEVFGDAWRPDCIDTPDDKDHREILIILRNAVRAGAVSAHWSTLDLKHSGDLRPRDADQEFFRFMLRDDLVFHHGLNEPVRCRFHAEHLRRLIRGQEVQPVTPTQRAKNQCIDWLVEMFADKDREIPPFAVLRQQAKERFPSLSDLAFKEARKLAIQKTGRDDLAKAGRRKNPISQ